MCLQWLLCQVKLGPGTLPGMCIASGEERAPVGLVDEVEQEAASGLGRVLHQLGHQVHPLRHPGLLVKDVVLGAALHALVVHHHVEALARKVPAFWPTLTSL